jgi:hypothetical protein
MVAELAEGELRVYITAASEKQRRLIPTNWARLCGTRDKID